MKSLLTVVFCLILIACASNPTNNINARDDSKQLGANGYTETVIGNTTQYDNGSSYYYQADDDTKTSGTRFAKERSGKIIATPWSLDESGNICETTTRNTVFCVAEAPNLYFIQTEDSNVFNYVDDDFANEFTVSQGDSLGLADQ